jgi:diaminohydroxyphosphoribosylaminopyrimidine deaminase / 5-amino-6-(5-phosphoribosylamino)uracil reductase
MFKSLGVAQAKNRNKKEGIEMTDQEYMLRAIQLAKKGEGWTNPNPMVGAVIVKDGKIIGEGYHKKYGELHAERNAIASLTESAEGAVIYVTLEPCCHHGKTPPCTEAIIEQKIRKVVIGSRDPNPKVAGKGVQMLREAGVTVVEDFMREECDQLNPVFFHYITTKTPYVVMKYAMTLDGKIAFFSHKIFNYCYTGYSRQKIYL